MNCLNRWVIGAAGLLMAVAGANLVSCSPQVGTSSPPSTAAEPPVTATETAAPNPTPTRSPTAQRMPSPTATSQFTPTAQPTRTPTPTATSRPTPTPVPVTDAIRYADDAITVYTRANNLCVLRRNEEHPIYLADATWLDDVQVSSDGEYVAFLRMRLHDLYTELWAVRSDGTDMRLLLTTADLEREVIPVYEWAPPIILHWEWLANSHLIALTTGDFTFGITRYGDVLLVDVDAITHTFLLPPLETWRMFFPSPDGNRIAVVTATTIGLVNTDGTDWYPNVLTYDHIVSYSDADLIFAHPVWEPDSTGFWVAIPPADRLAHGSATVPIWYVSASDREVVHIADIEWPLPRREITVISPDGTYIALVPPSYGGSEISVIRADTSEEIGRYFLGDRMGFVRWEPDSEHFIVWVDERYNVWVDQRYNLQRVGLDGDVEPLYALDGMPATSLPACAPDSE